MPLLWFGYRAQRDAGQADRRIGIRWGLHWLAFLVASGLGSALVAVGHLEWAGFGSLVVLLLSLTYFHAALHLDRRLLPISGVAAACYLVTLFVPEYQWTLAGVLMAAALVWQALLGVRTRNAAHPTSPDPTDPDIGILDELQSLNGLLDHRVRLAICVLLSKYDAMSFSRLKQVLEETDGSLGTHLRKLEDGGYLALDKTYRGRRPVTWYQLTADGQTRLEQHIANLMRLLGRAQSR